LAAPYSKVLLKGAHFHVTTRHGEPDEVRSALSAWFRSKAEEQFTKRVSVWISWCQKHHLPEPKMRLLKMLKRWGSAGHDGRISLNPDLIHQGGLENYIRGKRKPQENLPITPHSGANERSFVPKRRPSPHRNTSFVPFSPATPISPRHPVCRNRPFRGLPQKGES
jgi:hypothetical protein